MYHKTALQRTNNQLQQNKNNHSWTFKKTKNMPSQRRGIRRNMALENGLYDLGISRERIDQMTRLEQSTLYERLQQQQQRQQQQRQLQMIRQQQEQNRLRYEQEQHQRQQQRRHMLQQLTIQNIPQLLWPLSPSTQEDILDMTRSLRQVYIQQIVQQQHEQFRRLSHGHQQQILRQRQQILDQRR
jgi:hypothetical protein